MIIREVQQVWVVNNKRLWYFFVFVLTETRDIQHIPLNLIHFVAADPRYSNIFSMVARGKGNRFICHVFECNTPRQCETITSTLSEAFRVSYENWIRVEENQRRLTERREMDMGGLGKLKIRRLCHE